MGDLYLSMNVSIGLWRARNEHHVSLNGFCINQSKFKLLSMTFIYLLYILKNMFWGILKMLSTLLFSSVYYLLMLAWCGYFCLVIRLFRVVYFSLFHICHEYHLIIGGCLYLSYGRMTSVQILGQSAQKDQHAKISPVQTY